MQAIKTRYIGPGNVKGSRVSARCEGGSVTLNWDDALNSDLNHMAACLALIKKMGWDTGHHAPMIGGVYHNDRYWVFADDINTSKL